MKIVIREWGFMRVLILVMGMIAFVQAYIQKEAVLGIAGSFLLITAFANVVCCSNSSCAVKPVISVEDKRT